MRMRFLGVCVGGGVEGAHKRKEEPRCHHTGSVGTTPHTQVNHTQTTRQMPRGGLARGVLVALVVVLHAASTASDGLVAADDTAIVDDRDVGDDVPVDDASGGHEGDDGTPPRHHHPPQEQQEVQDESAEEAEAGIDAHLRARRQLREEVRGMFTHAYDNYMAHAFPADVLEPIACKGADTWGAISLTLLDTLDTLAIMNNATEFERGVRFCVEHLSFDVDETVSLFETNIRALGGLLAAHAFASNARLGLLADAYPSAYAGPHGAGLLPLARDLGDRLLPALDTESGIPYGSVNLRRGVAANESAIACTAAAGTLVLEFGALSRLTGDPKYEAAAKRAALAVWRQRSGHDLLGAHVNLKTGAWTQADAGIGRGIDSFYEYMLKGTCCCTTPSTSPFSTTRTTPPSNTSSTARGTSTSTWRPRR